MPDLALVLTAAPGSKALEAAHTDEIWSRLPAPARIDREWLAPAEAWQATFAIEDDRAAKALRILARDILAGRPVDINVVPDGRERRKKLLVADMESTLVEQEFLDEIAEVAGVGAKIAAVTRRAMNGEIAFEPALRERVAHLAGLDAGILETVWTRATLMPGAETLVRTMKAHNAKCALVSGGFTYFTGRLAARLGLDTHHANEIEIAGGRLTGRVREPVLGRDAKRAALVRLAAEGGLDLAETLAVGDGANDLGMIEAAGLGVAFRAKPLLASAAPAAIVHGDLTALLYLQGYRSREFAR